MSDHSSLETFRQAFSDFSDETVSVYVPRPAVEVGGEKWRILRKNVIDAVEKHAPKAKFILQRLEAFELADFRAKSNSVLPISCMRSMHNRSSNAEL